MYVPERLICDDENWSYSVRTDASTWLGGIGTGWAHVFDTERPVPRGFSCELEQLSVTISVVEARLRGNALHIGRVDVRERAIQPCGSNCHYDHTRTLCHLC